TDAAEEFKQGPDRGAKRPHQTLGRPRREIPKALGLRSAREERPAADRRREQFHRRVPSGAAETQSLETIARSVPPNLDPPRPLRRDRSATHSRRSGRARHGRIPWLVPEN